MNGTDNDVAGAAELLMAVLAGVNDEMNDLAIELRGRSGVVEVLRESDLRKHRDELRFEDAPCYSFEAYVEANTSDGHWVCWFVIINSTPSGWELDRTVTRSSDPESGVVDGLKFESFSEFAGKVPGLVKEFAESARRFEFDRNQSGSTRQLP
jgi:hypothetical protein